MQSVRYTSAKQSGFSLVELMVGMVISLLGVIIIMQVTVAFQAQKSTTSNGSKAQNTGAIALYAIQREIEQAGYGVSSTSIIGCSVQLPSGPTITLAPLLINDTSVAVGDKNTDTLLVAYGNPPLQTEGDEVSHAMSGEYAVLKFATYDNGTKATFNQHDYVIGAPIPRPTPCSGSSGLVLDVVASLSPPNTVTVQNGSSTFPTGTLYNLGPAPKIHAYAVRGGTLMECDFLVSDCSKAGSGWIPIAENIVSLRAQYGRDTTAPSMDGIVDKYDQAPPNTACQLVRIPAMRMALVARSSQYQKGVVTTTTSNGGVRNAPTWAGDQTDSIVGGGGNLGPGSAPDEPWKHYRYKVFETVIPMRNIAWMGAVSGC